MDFLAALSGHWIEIAAGLSAALASYWQYQLKQLTKKHPSPEQVLNGFSVDMRRQRLLIERLDANQERIEASLIRLEISHGALADRVETIEASL